MCTLDTIYTADKMPYMAALTTFTIGLISVLALKEYLIDGKVNLGRAIILLLGSACGAFVGISLFQ